MNKGIGFLLVLLLVSGLKVWGQCSPDFTAPTIICPPTQMMFLNGNCQVSLADLSSQATVSDACDPSPLVTQNPIPGTVVSGVGTAITVGLFAQDNSFNGSTCTFTAITADSTAPTINCPGNQALVLDTLCQAILPDYTGLSSRSDNCSSTISVSQSPPAGTPINGAGMTQVTLTAIDGSSNSRSCSFMVTHSDGIAPTPMCRNISLFLDAAGTASLSPIDLDNGSSDNCGTPTLSASNNAFTCADVGSNTVVLTASDANGNSATCNSTVNVVDTISPTAVCQDLTLFLDAAGMASVGSAALDGGSSDNCGTPNILGNQFNFTCGDIGPNSVNISVEDGSGNTAACTASVTIADSSAPTAVCQDLTVFLDGSGAASLNSSDLDGGSSDNCGSPSLASNQFNFTCADLGNQSASLTVTDNNGNSSNCASTVTVVDSTSPTAICQSISVFLDASGNAGISAADLDNGSSDNCGTPTLSASNNAFTCADVGSNTIVLTASDANGNSATCNSTVSVVDTISPTAVCQDLTLFLDAAGMASVGSAALDGGSSDNCGTPNILGNQFNFTCGDIGPNSVNISVEDGNGNTAACTATVTIADSSAPTAVCQDLTVFLNPNNIANVAAVDVDNGSQDNCGIVNQSVDSTMFDCNGLGNHPVVLSLTDASGNVSQCTSQVTVTDSTRPMALCSSGNLLLDNAGNASIDVSGADAGSSDNCGVDSMVYTNPQTFNCADAGAVATGTLLVYDQDGNVDSCLVSRSVEDEMSPTAVCQDDTIYLVAGLAALDANTVGAGSSDNCGVFSTTASPDTFFMANLGTNSVVVMVGDSSGNVDSCLSTVTVLDTTSISIDGNLEDLLNLAFFPNPTRGHVVLRWEDSQAYFGESVRITAANALGQVVIQDQWIVNGNREEHTYDLTPFGAGIYVFELKMASGRVFHKVLKQQ